MTWRPQANAFQEAKKKIRKKLSIMNKHYTHCSLYNLHIFKAKNVFTVI